MDMIILNLVKIRSIICSIARSKGMSKRLYYLLILSITHLNGSPSSYDDFLRFFLAGVWVAFSVFFFVE